MVGWQAGRVGTRRQGMGNWEGREGMVVREKGDGNGKGRVGRRKQGSRW